jgi:hypothetical protein
MKVLHRICGMLMCRSRACLSPNRRTKSASLEAIAEQINKKSMFIHSEEGSATASSTNFCRAAKSLNIRRITTSERVRVYTVHAATLYINPITGTSLVFPLQLALLQGER